MDDRQHLIRRVAELETELNRAKAKELLLRTLIDNVPDYIYIKDRESKFILAGAEAVRRLNKESENDLIGKTDLDLFVGDKKQRELAQGFFDDEQRIINTGESIVSKDEEIVDLRNGEKGWLSTTKVPLRDVDGNITGIIGIGRINTITKQALERLKTINEIVQVINTKPDIGALLETITEQLTQVLNCNHCTIFLAEQENEQTILVPHVPSTRGQPERKESILSVRFKPGEGSLAGLVFGKGQSEIFENAREHKSFAPSNFDRDSYRTILIAPVKIGNRAIGVISADHDQPGWFNDESVQLVEALAIHAGIAIERARVLKRLEEISNQILDAKQRTVDGILKTIVAYAIELTGTVSGTIFLVETSPGGKRRITHSYNYPESFEHPPPRLSDPDKKSVTRTIVESGKIKIFPEINDGSPVNPGLRKLGIRAMIGIPLKVSEHTIGVLYLNQDKPTEFSGIEISSVQTLANQAAGAIYITQLFDESQRRTRALEALAETNKALITNLSLREMLRTITKQTLQIGGWDGHHGCYSYVSIRIGNILTHIEASDDDFLKKLQAGHSFIDLNKVDDETEIAVHVAKSKTIHKQNYISEAPFTPINESTHAQVSVPVEIDPSTLVVVTIEHPDENAFSEKDVENLELLTSQTAMAIRFSRLMNSYSALAQTNMEGSVVLHRISRDMINIRNAADLFLELDKPQNVTPKALNRIKSIEEIAQDLISYLHRKKNKDVDKEKMTLKQAFGVIGKIKAKIEKMDLKSPVYVQNPDEALKNRKRQIRFDAESLEHVLDILINNALDEMKGQSVSMLTLKTTISWENMEIRVIDTGKGIRPDILHKLFYERISTKNDQTGSGVGLLMAQAIARKYGSLITIESTSDQGTTVVVSIPLEKKAA